MTFSPRMAALSNSIAARSDWPLRWTWTNGPSGSLISKAGAGAGVDGGDGAVVVGSVETVVFSDSVFSVGGFAQVNEVVHQHSNSRQPPTVPRRRRS